MTETHGQTDPWLRVAAVALRLGVSASKVRSLITEKKLDAIRHNDGGMYLVRQSVVETYLDSLQDPMAAEEIAEPITA